ncbi:NAD(P)/FAD-dependent oxidoreductase [Streptomyces sp. BE303]|uniref:NAD(P)/FAD-dependent oxidoreductase n=1 Tax=Streptomyces sp. BE303 TaxID=3002528 RepID=UPI002E78C7CD|nr:FAD-dependent monooxygenase [Streptomyces sp. BE303]MED7950945.1 FAD-dependent monooxygenase [Streptomyces sp. BE303]
MQLERGSADTGPELSPPGLWERLRAVRSTTEPPNHADSRRAVIVGAGIAGLLAARVLADHYPDVVVLDRDRLPATPANRRGTPQDRHVHALFTGGLRAIDALLPDFTDELSDRGGHRIDVGRDLALATRHGWGVRFDSGLHAVGASRPLIEATVRQRVLAVPGVHLLQHTQADGLIGSPQHLGAVRVRDLTTGTVSELAADLVVDAGGRGSHLPQWLARLGCPPVPETVVNAHTGYATRLFRLPRPPALWRSCYVMAMGPHTTRGGAIAPVEGDRWIVTLYGIGRDRPTPAAEDFLPFARSLPAPAIAEALTDAEPLTPVRCTNATTNRRRHLARAGGLPDNLVAIGDSSCCFNPVYAQGMTVAALSARVLASSLDRQGVRPGFARRYHHRLDALHSTPWMLATTADLAFRGTEGPAPSPVRRLLARHLDRVIAAGTHDRHAQAAFLEVLTMAAHPAVLLTPRVALSAATARHGTSHPPTHSAPGHG